MEKITSNGDYGEKIDAANTIVELLKVKEHDKIDDCWEYIIGYKDSKEFVLINKYLMIVINKYCSNGIYYTEVKKL